MEREIAYGIIPLKQVDRSWFVFVVQHRAGHWAFPKGHREGSESPKETACRELFEETGLKNVSFISEISFEETYQFFRDKCQIDKKVVYFLAKVEGEIVLSADEIKDGKWINLQDAHLQVTFPQAKATCHSVTKLMNL